MGFYNKVVIVTGASSGIGAATAIEFSKQGADVVLVGRNKTKLDNVAAECSKVGKKPFIITADITKDAETVIHDTVSKYGKLDVLVNNAGSAVFCSIKDEGAMQSFDNMMNINLRAIVQLTHLALPHLIKTKGNVVNVSSIAALKVSKAFAYCVAKAGVDHFTRCAGQEFGQYGVRVNGVNPGPVMTDFAENMQIPNSYAFMKSMADTTALKRVSEPREIADVIVFLASEKAKCVTGSSWVSDNGSLVVL